MKIKNIIYNPALISFIGIIIIGAMILLSPDRYIYDERYFVRNIPMLHELGLSNLFLNKLAQSPGPLYEFFHAPFDSITQLDPIKMRVFNFSFFVLLILLTFVYFKINNISDSVYKAFLYVSVPMTWTITGLALTEIPAMFCLILSILLLNISLSTNKTSWGSYLLVGLAGVCLGCSIIGRSQMLMVLAFTPFLFLLKGKQGYIMVYIATALVLPIWVFSVWKGFVPPCAQRVQGGFDFTYGLLALGYLALLTLFICYKWYYIPRTFYLISFIVFVFFFILNMKFQFVGYEPLKTTIEKIPLNFIIKYYPYFMPSVLFGVGTIYLLACSYHIFQNRSNVWFVFILISALLIVATTVKSTAQFSSRYVVQALPLLLITYAGYIEINRKALLLQIVGMLIGVISLYNYYLSD